MPVGEGGENMTTTKETPRGRGGRYLYLFGALLLALFALALIPRSTGVTWGYAAPPSVATSTPACGLAWRQVGIPLPPGNSELDGVAGLSPNAGWAVGSYGDRAGAQTLTMHRD